MKRDVFAEIEYEPSKPGNSLAYVTKAMEPFLSRETAAKIVPASSLIKPSEVRLVSDPIRQKFFDMRDLAPSNPMEWGGAKLFYKQAKFMEDFTDDYEGVEEFTMHIPCYQRMGYGRLRTYFTWRTRIRRGEFPPVALSYLFIYIYELLAGIGVRHPADGLDRLMTLWNEYREAKPDLDNHFPDRLRDYHVYYDLNFLEFVEKNKLREFYPETVLYNFEDENCLDAWNKLSAYDIKKSKFCNADPKNLQLLGSCFRAALRALNKLCEAEGKQLKDLVTHTNKNPVPWTMFARDLFHNSRNQPDRVTETPDGAIFICKDNRWTTHHAMPYMHRKDLAGYLIKKTEAVVRSCTGFKTKINANPNSIKKAEHTLRRIPLQTRDLENTIEAAVNEFFAEMNRVVVSVDTKNLTRIREEAEDTAEKLIVEETSPPSVIKHEPPPVSFPCPESHTGFAVLRSVLSESEFEILTEMLTQNTNFRSLAEKHGIMPEVLADSINDKATDTTGDNILDDKMEIFEEYRLELLDFLHNSEIFGEALA